MANAAIKRQRKRKRVDTDGDPEFQVAPMIDVLLVLMLFFMMITSTEVLKNDKAVHLPEANHAKPKEPGQAKHEITINVEWNSFNQSASYNMDSYTANTPDGLAGAIAAKHAADPEGYVVIRADKDVEYSNISDLMTVCGNAGIGSVAFSVLLNNNQPGAAPPATTASQ
jgi:biopolymer transport protein ExbD